MTPKQWDDLIEKVLEVQRRHQDDAGLTSIVCIDMHVEGHPTIQDVEEFMSFLDEGYVVFESRTQGGDYIEHNYPYERLIAIRLRFKDKPDQQKPET